MTNARSSCIRDAKRLEVGRCEGLLSKVRNGCKITVIEDEFGNDTILIKYAQSLTRSSRDNSRCECLICLNIDIEYRKTLNTLKFKITRFKSPLASALMASADQWMSLRIYGKKSEKKKNRNRTNESHSLVKSKSE